MGIDRRFLYVGAAMILAACMFRKLSQIIPQDFGESIPPTAVVEALLYLQTGRHFQLPEADPVPETEPTQAPTQPPTEAPTQAPTEAPLPRFTQEDAQLVGLRNATNYDIDIPALLTQPLSWQLRQDDPTVLILHTHGSESYRNTEGYSESTGYRTLDNRYNVVSLGETLATLLEEAGISVIHDQTRYDEVSYNGSYAKAREQILAHLQEHPSICLILDLHRDAMTDSAGNQIGYTCQTAAGTGAKLMLVVGSDAGDLYYPNWPENLSLGIKLHAALEQTCPGLCRDLALRTGRYNQDLFPNMVLVEVGAAGNTRQEALTSIEYLAQAIVSLADGVP